ncbi:YbjN domain-containing protein [Sphingopyxis granuli]|uniref:YbjN domain-containing protein n=1 Tax=Sphingopyxis granuli TaxID=267128 RepID=UPI001F530200|nr:YbjN domain-containing protein [Sphingopyxis granuli]UNK79503.1 YbjN domain-containing protein [Sphingopyxis granuli]
MNPILSEDEVTIENLAALLESAAISYKLDDDGDIHVTEFSSTYFLFLDTDKKVLRFQTTAPVRSTDTAALLDFTNRCNSEVAMIQFSYMTDAQRFRGDYSIPYRGGVLRSHILRIAREFPDHFNYVFNKKDEDNPLGDADPAEPVSVPEM